MTARYTGKVKWFNDKKGFGFIETKDNKEVFIHYTGIISDKKHKSLNEGDEVEFEITEGKKGDKAINLRVLTPAI